MAGEKTWDIHEPIQGTWDLTLNVSGTHTKNDRTEERTSWTSFLMSILTKVSTLWPSKAPFGCRQLFKLIENKDLKVYGRLTARTGTDMFQYLSIIGIAHHNNRSAVFNNAKKLKTIFPKLEVNNYEGNTIDLWKTLFEKSEHAFDPKFFNLPQQNMMLENLLQSFKYFEDIFGDIYNKTLSYFNETLLTRARRFIQMAKHNYKWRNNIEIKETKITSVCVHVSRGDFVAGRTSRLNNIVPSALDIQNAMNYMEKKFEHTVFIVMSNGLKWCKVNLNRTNVYFSNTATADKDFVLMCNCDHMIMTVGTFGWWGAWFTSWRGGIAMYYEQPFYKNTWKYKTMNRHDWFPPHWLAYTNKTVIESKYLGDR